MENLASLPPSMLLKILSKVATNHLWDFGSARISFSGFNQAGREEYFYRYADLFHLYDWIDEVNVLTTFRLRCYQVGNPQAIYLQDGMLNLTFSIDERGFIHNYPSFTREFFDRMLCTITTKLYSGYWAYEKPETFMSLLKKINPNVSHDCRYSTIEPLMFEVSLDGSRTQCKCDRCFWQCVAWDFCNEIHLTAASWPIED